MTSANDMVSALDVALLVAAALEAIGCEYFIGGSVASSLQGEPRATNDIDIVVAMLPHRVRPFAEKLGEDFEVDQEMLRDALVHGRCANIFYLPMVTKIDIFALGHDRVMTKWNLIVVNESECDPPQKNWSSNCLKTLFYGSLHGTAMVAKSLPSNGAMLWKYFASVGRRWTPGTFIRGQFICVRS
jgi:hypothetical protein